MIHAAAIVATTARLAPGVRVGPYAVLEDDTELADVDYSDKKIGIRLEMELNKPLGVATYNTQAALRNFKVRELTEEERKDEGSGMRDEK